MPRRKSNIGEMKAQRNGWRRGENVISAAGNGVMSMASFSRGGGMAAAAAALKMRHQWRMSMARRHKSYQRNGVIGLVLASASNIM